MKLPKVDLPQKNGEPLYIGVTGHRQINEYATVTKRREHIR